MLGNSLTFPLPPLAMLAATNPIISPLAIIVLCVVAGIGTKLLLPARGEQSVRKLGGTILTLAALILVAVVIHGAAGQDHSGTGLYFWIFSAIALVGAIRVVTHPRPV